MLLLTYAPPKDGFNVCLDSLYSYLWLCFRLLWRRAFFCPSKDVTSDLHELCYSSVEHVVSVLFLTTAHVVVINIWATETYFPVSTTCCVG